MEDHSAEALAAARRLRSEMSLPEVLLWRVLRLRPFGLKFRRQHPIGQIVVDFYCAELRLVVEIDGQSHNMGDRPERDQRRDTWLRNNGYSVLRIAATDVLKDAPAVAESLGRFCRPVPPPSALRAATSPSGGGFTGMH